MATTSNGPILFEEIHRKVRELQPLVFEGVRLILNRPLTPHFQLSHSMSLGTLKSSYKLGANYMGTKQISPVEYYPVMASEMQCDGSLNANLIHQINQRLKAKVVASFQSNQCTGSQASVDYTGDNFTTTLTAANIDLIKNDGILVGQSLHQISKSISIGPELVIQYGMKDSQRKIASQLSLAGRFTADKFHVDSTLSHGGAHFSYFQKANENLHFGAELMTDRTMGETNAGFYYQYDLTKSHTTIRGSIDSAWNVGSILEKRFYPLPITLMLSARLNHLKNSTSVGIGLSVG